MDQNLRDLREQQATIETATPLGPGAGEFDDVTPSLHLVLFGLELGCEGLHVASTSSPSIFSI